MCEYCEEYKPLFGLPVEFTTVPLKVVIAKGFMGAADKKTDYWCGRRISYCPMCGKKLGAMMNKTLLQILVDDLPRRDGWPDGAYFCAQNGCNSYISFGVKERYEFIKYNYQYNLWTISSFGYPLHSDFAPDLLSIDHATAIVTKEQYEAALKENQNE